MFLPKKQLFLGGPLLFRLTFSVAIFSATQDEIGLAHPIGDAEKKLQDLEKALKKPDKN